MSGMAVPNRFAAPRAEVADQIEGETGLVEAGRGDRFLAALIDGIVPALMACLVIAAVAVPAYERYQQQHVPGIEPPPLGSGHHLLAAWAWVGGLAFFGYAIYSVALLYLYGQTFGKRVMNIRVVRTGGERVTFARFVFLRWLPLALARGVPLIGLLVWPLDVLLIFRDSRRCLHDDIADTRVVTAASSVDATLHGDPKNAVASLRTISF
jgi:uncharacterized RDD family membrane protein YckC